MLGLVLYSNEKDGVWLVVVFTLALSSFPLRYVGMHIFYVLTRLRSSGHLDLVSSGFALSATLLSLNQ